MIRRYLGKISGPLLDRIDIHIEVPAVAYQELRGKDDGVTSAEIRGRVAPWTIPASALWKWPCAAWGSPHEPMTAS
jgi:Magnesium chelatase, subunit ChlI